MTKKKNRPGTVTSLDEKRPRPWWRPKALTSTDGWSNPVSGMGILGRDKSESTTFARGNRLTQGELDALTRDGLASKVVGRIVDDALRSGWVVNFAGDGDESITAEEADEFNKRLELWHKKVRFSRNISQHLKQSRHYGGALLAIGAMDGQDPSEPLNPEKVSDFNWMRPHDRYQVSQSGELEEDPNSKDFGYPANYFLYRTHASSTASVKQEDLLNRKVHASRLWRTDAVDMSERVRQQNDGWSDSVLEAVHEPLAGFSASMKGARTIIQEFIQGVYKIKNLSGIILANGDEEVRKRWAIMDYIKSLYNAVMIDADQEEYSRISASVAGLSDLLDRFMIHFSAVAQQPMTLLFGISPSGFGTGEAEGDNWDDTVKSYQTDYIEPLLEYVYGILFRTREFEDFPKNWSIQFNSLELTSPLEDADVRLKTSQADAIDINAGILDATEVAKSRYGGATYSTETVLDEEAREMEAAIEEEGLGLGDREALSGIQISSMLDILERVKIGTLPKASAKVALPAALPQLTPDEVNGMIDPIEVTGPTVDPETGLPLDGAPVPIPLQAGDQPTDNGESSEPDDDDSERGRNR